MNIAILTYEHVELLDMMGPTDVFLWANRINGSAYNVYTVAESIGTVHSEEKIVTITPGYTLQNCPEPDIIIIPGLLTDNFTASSAITNWIIAKHQQCTHILSICVGAFTLAKTGLLNGRNATTHHTTLTKLQTAYPKIHITGGVRFVEDGKYITTAGITSGIDGALRLVEKMENTSNAKKVADMLVYKYNQPLL